MTNFNWLLDGSIVGLYLLVTMVAGLMVRKYVGNVEDFLVAGREMDVYLGIASLAATEFGIVTCMYTAQNGYEKGFAGAKSMYDYENNLYNVFSKSFEVLKPNRYMVLTFNNKDVGAWIGLLFSIFRSGFTLAENGLFFQLLHFSYFIFYHSEYHRIIYFQFMAI